MQPPEPIIVECPKCHSRSRSRAEWAGRIVGCPRCKTPILVPNPGARRTEDHAGPEGIPGPKLTGSHFCPVYDCPNPSIREPIGKRVVEVLHGACGHTVSLFASLYRCPICLSARTLESPRAQWGRTIPCPFGPHELVVPDDLILRESDPFQEEGPRMRFTCPGCLKALEAGTRFVGRWAVCPHCALAVVVPPSGEPVPPPTNRAAVHEKPWVRCESYYCQRRVPSEYSVCPHCQRALHHD